MVNMSVKPIKPSIQTVRPSQLMGANQRSPRKLEIGPTLEKALAATLNGKLQWQPVLELIP